ncbi:DUF5320 domain-containing protein [Desulfosporosinus youngiae]|uniref:Uncharacterized protein n=1 Tax=Desulfosporosinus youngiae DSM 17734 TaxID=768710 RepID=H5XTD5_9FIRM|nr:DUF5320 domain-containing protein [Desulfosporosinus youngiae]EHQ88394.1 hypothetical protein DesyoDRAFT_1226 [Desulfosporosinus youngiae DSM 17734]
MPRRDGTGPEGRSSMNGGGLGLGTGYRRGPGKNFIKDPNVVKTQKERLQEQKELLESKLKLIYKQLENL